MVMTADLDAEDGLENLKKLKEFFERNQEDRNEATTRFQLINQLLLDCLGWDVEDITTEDYTHEGGYTDFTLRLTTKAMIVEAKRQGHSFTLPIDSKKLTYSLPFLCEQYPELGKAIRQVHGYCSSEGVQFAVVSNGHQLIAFIATRTDGIAPLDGQALVFSSFDSMYNNFIKLWNNLSRNALINRNLIHTLLGDIQDTPPAKISRKIQDYPGVSQRNIFQVNLKVLTELVFEEIAKDPQFEEDFLKHCYCESGALSQSSLLTKNILTARYARVGSNVNPAPVIMPATTKSGVEPEFSHSIGGSRPILLLGDVGVGKTTFVRHLIKVSAPEIFENSIYIYINLGAEGVLEKELEPFVMDSIHSQLKSDYGINVYKNGFVRHLYQSELKEFEDSVAGQLKDIAPQEYLKKEITYLEGLMAKKAQHLQKALQSVKKSNRKDVIIFIDNADQRSYNTQQQAFLIAHEIATTWAAVVFLSLRPTTFNQSIKKGTLSGYHPKAFTISPARADWVITKRLEYAKRVLSGQVPVETLDGGKLNEESLSAVVSAFIESLRYDNNLTEFIDNISAGNLRHALDFVREFFGSSHVNTEKINQIYRSSGSYYIPLHELLRSVIFNGTRYYSPIASPIANLFDMNSQDGSEHFLTLIILDILNQAQADTQSQGFISGVDLAERLQIIGFDSAQIDRHTTRCLDWNLIRRSNEGSADDIDFNAAYRISSSGAYHLLKLPRMFAYVDAVVVDTPICDHNTYKKLKIVENISERLERVQIFVDYLDQQWMSNGAHELFSDWKGISDDIRQDCEEVQKRLSRIY